ncbi:Rne/Rng family ribonuclease [Pikeienuella piscinae]|uniref:Ribonuclease E n=1 Tax=Pikeienuella piscinae TaxID=2748098 RepID=A0A7L5BUN7_9RHOB|nr:ribonuclease E/G [Pikeienuella piscinae]QIE55362.1 Rne/Rng family ribonuclease [Pikeienuella piscinae]
MAKKMLIDATHPEETRVVVMDGTRIDEFDFESINKRQLAGNIYLAKVTRVEPSLQAAFIEYGGNRHGFLAFSEIHPDYYQIPFADREAIIEAEAVANAADEEEEPRKTRSRRAPRSRSRRRKSGDAGGSDTNGMETADGETSAENGAAPKPATVTPTNMEIADADPVKAEAPYPTTEEVETPESPPAETQVAAAETETAGDATTESAEDSDTDERGDSPNSIAEDSGADDGESVSEAPRHAVEPNDDDDGDDDDANRDAAKDEVESVGAEKVEDEIRPRRAPTRRYKIQEVVKVRQIMLVQVVKEERGNKGAALTTYLSLAGRYCVLMPNTARGGGISRKITQASDRQKLKEIAGELEVPKGMGLIVRTAGAKRTKTEIKRDYEFLLRQWEQIRDLTLASMAPALIYEEGSLIKRSIRDLYGRDIDSILVEGEEAYREAKDYMKMLMPSHAKNVQAHREATPLFSKYQVESHLSAMFNPTVQLKSGGYIVIGVTEALVAIDVNSGRSTREHSIEETALKTNLEASDEVARQLRLRDLAGLIVIDYIDMDENRNNRAVEKRLKERLKNDRARIQVGRISAFGLMEMSRQRLRPGMIEATTAPCAHCHGTGIVRSADNVALAILREVEEEGVHARVREVKVIAPVGIANFLMNQKRKHVAQIEARYGIDLLIEADPTMISPDYKLEKVKGARQAPRPAESPRTITAETAYDGAQADSEAEDDTPVNDASADSREKPERNENTARSGGEGDGEGKRRRRGKRGGRKRRRSDDEQQGETRQGQAREESAALGEVIETSESGAPEDNLVATADETAQKPKRARPASRRKAVAAETAGSEAAAEDSSEAPAEPPAEAAPDTPAEAPETPAVSPAKAAEERGPETETVGEEAPAKPKRKPRARKPKAAPAEAEANTAEAAGAASVADAPTPPPAEPVVAAEIEPAPQPEPQPQPRPAPEPEPEPELAVAEAPKPDKPRRRGWWS